MSIMSETAARAEAISLEKVLVAALESKNLAVIQFCKQNIIPLYDDAVDSAYGSYNRNNDLLKKLYETPNQLVDFGANYGI